MKTTIRLNRDYTLPILLVLLLMGAWGLVEVPSLFGRAPDEEAMLQANRRRIEQMTQPERDRLRLRAERYFKELSEEERQKLRRLHEDLRKHPQAAALKQTLQRYNEWLSSLSPYELGELRSRLRETNDVTAQRQLIETTLKKQKEKQFLRSLDTRQRALVYMVKDPKEREQLIRRMRESAQGGRRPGYPPPLTVEQMDELTGVIAGLLSLSNADREALKTLPPSQRHVRLLNLAMNEHLRQRQAGQRGLLGDAELRPVLEKKITDPELKARLQSILTSRRYRYGVLFLISRSIYHERRQERGEPTEEQLRDFLSQLPPEKQQELVRYRGGEKREMLKRMYFNGGPGGEEFQQFRRLMMRITFRYFGNRRPPFRGEGTSRNRESRNREEESSRKNGRFKEGGSRFPPRQKLLPRQKPQFPPQQKPQF